MRLKLCTNGHQITSPGDEFTEQRKQEALALNRRLKRGETSETAGTHSAFNNSWLGERNITSAQATIFFLHAAWISPGKAHFFLVPKENCNTASARKPVKHEFYGQSAGFFCSIAARIMTIVAVMR